MIDIFNIFKSDFEYKQFLHDLKWRNKITCPYCYTIKKIKNNDKFIYHCNLCNSNHSLTVNTIMQDSKIDLRKWLQALYIFTFTEKISYRKLAIKLNVNKNTAYLIIDKLYFLHTSYKLEIAKIIGLTTSEFEILSRILLISQSKERYKNVR